MYQHLAFSSSRVLPLDGMTHTTELLSTTVRLMAPPTELLLQTLQISITFVDNAYHCTRGHLNGVMFDSIGCYLYCNVGAFLTKWSKILTREEL